LDWKEQTLLRPLIKPLLSGWSQKQAEANKGRLSEPFVGRLSEPFERRLSEPFEGRLSEPFEGLLGQLQLLLLGLQGETTRDGEVRSSLLLQGKTNNQDNMVLSWVSDQFSFLTDPDPAF